MCFNLSISPRTLPPVLALRDGLQFLHSLDKPLLYDLQLDGDGTQVDVEDLGGDGGDALLRSATEYVVCEVGETVPYRPKLPTELVSTAPTLPPAPPLRVVFDRLVPLKPAFLGSVERNMC